MKHLHDYKYYYQKDRLGNTHLIIACSICDKAKGIKCFRPLSEADSIPYKIEWRISKRERKRIEKLNQNKFTFNI
jgi:hypothetical protein